MIVAGRSSDARAFVVFFVDLDRTILFTSPFGGFGGFEIKENMFGTSAFPVWDAAPKQI